MTLIKINLDRLEKTAPAPIHLDPVVSPRSHRIIELYRSLWAEAHLKIDATATWFASWMARVPGLECGCLQWLRDYVKANPPDFENWPRYIWELHNAVNAKLKKPAYPWSDCLARYPTWKKVEGNRIGVVSSCYEIFGGTETFHQTIAPRLANVVGFASLNSLRGDAGKLGVPTGQGAGAIASMSAQCDTVISWNIDWETNPRPKRLITVHHGSIADTWGTGFATQGDLVVVVNEEVATHMRKLTSKPVIHIPNAVDPSRIEPRNAVDTDGKKICLWSHRFSSDKRYQLAVEIAKSLPGDWHMVLTGHRGEPIEQSDRVTILPPTHPGDWLSVASCFLSTSIFEGFGLSIAEAVAAGVPVVSSPVGIASRPGLAVTVPIDASPEEWAAAIVSSGSHALPPRDLFCLDAFLQAWESAIAQVSRK